MSTQKLIKKYNLQLSISYLGILPFIFVLVDHHIIKLFSLHFLKDFIIFYTLIIFTFIGAMRWDFDANSNYLNIIYGFCPSLISFFFIICNLLQFNKDLILSLILICLILQLIFDFIFYKIDHMEFFFYFYVRLPVTIMISLIFLYLIFV